MPEGIWLHVPAVKGGKFSHVLLTYYNQKWFIIPTYSNILSFSSMDEYSMKMRKFLLLCIFFYFSVLSSTVVFTSGGIALRPNRDLDVAGGTVSFCTPQQNTAYAPD